VSDIELPEVIYSEMIMTSDKIQDGGMAEVLFTIITATTDTDTASTKRI